LIIQSVPALKRSSSNFSPKTATKISENEIQDLTNVQDITDFYEYTEDCLESITKLTIPPIEDFGHLVLDLPFEEELKCINYI